MAAFCSWITSGVPVSLAANAIGAAEKPPTEKITFALCARNILIERSVAFAIMNKDFILPKAP